jgi:hypothetical protein
MKMKRMLAALAGLGLLAGCASSPVKTTASTRPDWVMKGSGAYATEAGTVFFGVGIANPMPNFALQRKACDARAREDVAATLKTSVQSLTKDFMDHHVDAFDPANSAGSDEMVQSVAKSVVDAELVDCRVIDHWEDPETRVLYGLARMDMNSSVYDAYKENLKKAIRDNHGRVVAGKMADLTKELDSAVQGQREREKEILKSDQPAPEIPKSVLPDASPAPAAK